MNAPVTGTMYVNGWMKRSHERVIIMESMSDVTGKPVVYQYCTCYSRHISAGTYVDIVVMMV